MKNAFISTTDRLLFDSGAIKVSRDNIWILRRSRLQTNEPGINMIILFNVDFINVRFLDVNVLLFSHLVPSFYENPFPTWKKSFFVQCSPNIAMQIQSLNVNHSQYQNSSQSSYLF